MGINREEVIKALECCIESIDCTLCPYFDEYSCLQILNENALALINELTEANERLTENALKIAEQHQAYIIRKMQNRLLGKFNISDKAMYSQSTVHDVISHIANELLENT